MEELLNRIERLARIHDKVPDEVIKSRDIKPGLRNPDGSGVVAGITTKGDVVGYEKIPAAGDGGAYKLKHIEGKLLYCGYDVEDIVCSLLEEKRFGFDEIVYLLLTGELPDREDLKVFSEEMAKKRHLSKEERSILMEDVHNDNQMYGLHSAVSHICRVDPNPDSLDIKDVARQSLNLISKIPTIIANNYNVTRFRRGFDLQIFRARQDISTAENFLYMILGHIPDSYIARIFDIAMVLHAEHGGGNNSTFAVRVVSSSGANTYMSIAAGLASLSGSLHGGANEQVSLMMKDIRRSLKPHYSESRVRAYLTKILDREAGDRTGKIYGFGHAVYRISDPRAKILKMLAYDLAKLKGKEHQFYLYDTVERAAASLLRERKERDICVNVDFYSGFIYKLIGIPRELYTPIFAMSRVAGWSAHRLEQILEGKIIRPGYLHSLEDKNIYKSVAERKCRMERPWEL